MAGTATAVQRKWLQTIVIPAQASALVWKVPASVTMAQAILESAWGTSGLALLANNLFGVKAKQGGEYCEFSTNEVIGGKTVRELAKFAKYERISESFSEHAYLLATLPRYAPAMVHVNVAKDFAQMLGPCGYSTDPQYGVKLLALMRDYELERYEVIPPPGAAAKEEAA